jgi:VIT1/CCC1 family predicted Fe2+/Mn2+ transporter
MVNGRGDEQQFAESHEARRARAQRLGGTYVGDWVLGANDGVITTFAVVAGARGGALGLIAVLVLGFANLLADGFSMGASNYLGRRSLKAYIQSEEEALRWEIEHEPEEKKDELGQQISRMGIPSQYRECMIGGFTSGVRPWLRALMAFGFGLEDHEGQPWKHGLITLIAFIIAGAFPLLPYLILPGEHAFTASSVAAAVTLFAAGALRTLITGISWLRSGLEMLAVGSLAALVAYGVGHYASALAGRG